MGLDIYLYKHELVAAGDNEEEGSCVEINSTIDPEHYFKIGYFRSSYNEGGINRVLKNLKVPDLYEIFNPGDDYRFQPDWNNALKMCSLSIGMLMSKPNYRVTPVELNQFDASHDATDEVSAMQVFLSQLEKNHDSVGYSNKAGLFYPNDGIKVFGFIPGTRKAFMGNKDWPTTYIITEGENEWYLTALKIVKETIEYVLAQPDKEKYWLHWSS